MMSYQAKNITHVHCMMVHTRNLEIIHVFVLSLIIEH